MKAVDDKWFKGVGYQARKMKEFKSTKIEAPSSCPPPPSPCPPMPPSPCPPMPPSPFPAPCITLKDVS